MKHEIIMLIGGQRKMYIAGKIRTDRNTFTAYAQESSETVERLDAKTSNNGTVLNSLKAFFTHPIAQWAGWKIWNLVVARSTRARDALFMNEEVVSLIQLLLSRLEHISADSVWAHRASGIRGSLFKVLEKLENGETVPGSKVESLIAAGFRILENVLNEKFCGKAAHSYRQY